MAKRKKSQQTTSETPRQALKNRGRSLQLHECWVNRGWVKSKIANVIVSRKHTNGNISFAVFLVDLYLKGVKDGLYRFNIPFTEYEEIIQNFYKGSDPVEIDYLLAHNIIYGAIEFATDVGYSPAAEFDTARYLLEEDDDHIDLIDIHFGYKGKPCLLMHYDDNYEKDKAKLERTFDPNEYILIDPSKNHVFHDPENDYFASPKNSLEEYNRLKKNKAFDVEDFSQMLNDAFNIELVINPELLQKNTIEWYPQDIYAGVTENPEGVDLDFAEDQDWFLELLNKIETLKPRKIKRQKETFISFFQKYPEHIGANILKIYYFDRLEQQEDVEIIIQHVLSASNLPLPFRTEIAKFRHIKRAYDKIPEVFSGAFLAKEINDIVSELFLNQYYFYIGIYFLSIENIRQAEQYLHLITKNQEEEGFKLKESLRLKIMSQKAIQLGLEASLPKVLSNAPL